MNKRTLDFRLTFGLGGSSAVLFALLVASGALLMLVYEATPQGAYTSVASLQQGSRFGGWVRNIHFLSANLLVATALLHLLRVFLTGAFHGPRRLNWVIGVGLLFSVLAANFTGYLLPWDQLAYWAITICTGMLGIVPLIGASLESAVRGGESIGPATLATFYALHTTLIPLTLLILMGLHFWRVRRARGVVVPGSTDPPKSNPDDFLPANPHLLVRELSVGVALVATVFLLAVFVDAPLGLPANPGLSPNPAKAPWYFAGLQEAQHHFHPLVGAVVMPPLIAGALLSLPYLKGTRPPVVGIWFLSRQGRRLAALSAGASVAATLALIVTDEFLLQSMTTSHSGLTRGVVPLVVGALIGWGLFWLIVKRGKGSLAELNQTCFVALFSSWAVLTAIGTFFRGTSMALRWPFDGGPP